MDIEVLGSKLPEIRKLFGWTQEYLTIKMGVKKTTIVNIENSLSKMNKPQAVLLIIIIKKEFDEKFRYKGNELSSVLEIINSYGGFKRILYLLNIYSISYTYDIKANTKILQRNTNSSNDDLLYIENGINTVQQYIDQINQIKKLCIKLIKVDFKENAIYNYENVVYKDMFELYKLFGGFIYRELTLLSNIDLKNINIENLI